MAAAVPPAEGLGPFEGILPTAQPVTLSFLGATGTGPPDTSGAVGPAQFLLVLNTVIRSFDKHTGIRDGAVDMALSTFFRPVSRGGAFDPMVKFDRATGRWFVMALDRFTASNRLMLAVSDAGVLTAGTRWTFFQFRLDEPLPVGDSAGCAADFPAWGINATALYVNVSVDLCPSGKWHADVFVIDKQALLARGVLVVTSLRSVQGDGLVTKLSGVPVDDFDEGGDTAYFIDGVDLTRITTTGSAPQLQAVTKLVNVISQGWPFGIPHKGNDLEAAGGGRGRLFLAISSSKSAVKRQGRIWIASLTAFDHLGNTALSEASRMGLRWREVADVDSQTPWVVRTGRLFAPSGANDLNQRNYWMPAIAVSGQGHLIMGGSAAGREEYANAFVVGRLAGDPINMFRAPVLFTDARTPYLATPDADGIRRWGDYSQASVDPCDDMTMWTVQQHAATTTTWGVTVARVAAPPPAMPVATRPAVVPAHAVGIELLIDGRSSNGSGFHDNGLASACRLAVAVDGGVAVGEVESVTPTS